MELQQAFDDVLEQMKDPETAALVAELALQTHDPVQQRQWDAVLARRLAADWKSAK